MFAFMIMSKRKFTNIQKVVMSIGIAEGRQVSIDTLNLRLAQIGPHSDDADGLRYAIRLLEKER
jgi:hypothetical protein